jgi:hypothetical protein
MALVLIITTAGRAAIRNADASGTRAVRIASVGVSAAALAATATTAALPGEIKRITTVSGAAVAADIIHLAVSDETMATYTVRSFALYLDDGTLFAAYGQADPIIEKSAQALMVLTVDVTLADIAASQITFGDANFLMPPATVDTRGLIELATVAEAKAGEDQARAVTPATAKAAVRDWIGYTPANRAGDTFTGPLAIRHADRNLGLMIAHSGTGYGFLQLGDAANPAAARTWHLGSQDDGSFALYQGIWGNGLLRLHVTATTIAFNGGPVWHAANDGAGSGLDADLLDGRQASDFALLTGAAFSGRVVAPAVLVDGGDARLVLRNLGSPADDAHGWTIRSIDDQLRFVSPAGVQVTINPFTGAAFAGPVVAPSMMVDGGDAKLVLRNLGNPADDAHGWTIRSESDVLRFLSPVGVQATLHPFSGFNTAGPITQNGAQVFHTSNDGAGSGMDADLLDGQQGSWYGDIPARLGYTPASRAGDTFTGPIAIRHTARNLGLMVGQSGTGYGFLQLGDAANPQPQTSWHLGSQDDGSVALYQGIWGSGTLRLRVTATAVSYNGSTVWHAGNDGAGSGLDADLLDGRQAAEFALLAGAAFTGNVSAASLSAPILYATASSTGRAVAIGNDAWLGDVDVANAVCVTGNYDGGSGYMCFGASRALLGSTNGGAIAIGGSVVWHAGNDGAGSGLDADLLDGRQAAEFALLAGAAFTGNVSAASLSAPILYATASGSGRAVAIGDDGWLGDVNVANTVCVSGSQDAGSGYLCFGSSRSLLGSTNGGAIAIGGSMIWHAGNDGAGSGLDADLLDGQDGEWYRRWVNLTGVPGAFPPTGHSHGAADLASAFAGSLAENGYTVLPNGLILQWMTGPMQAARTSAANYMQWPITFPTACLQAFVSTQMQQAGDRGDSWFQLVGAPDQNGATIQRQASGTADDIVASAPRVFAIGH